MTDDNATSAGGKGRRRPLPVVDLEATEIESKAIESKESKPVGAAAPTPAGDPPAVDAAAGAPSAPADPVASEPPPPPPPPLPPPVAPASAASAAAPPAGRRPGWAWRAIGAGVAGGAVALLALLIADFLPGREPAAPAPDARLAGLEQQLRDLAGRPLPAPVDRATINDLTTRLARVEAALASPRGSASDPALANRLSTLEGDVKAMAETVAIVGRRSDEAAASARETRQRADATAAALAELTQRVTRLTAAPAAPRGELDALSKRIDANERAGKALEAELAKLAGASASDKPLRLAVVAAALKGAVERGDGYAAELAVAKALALEPKTLAPLEAYAAAGLPSAAALARELAALVPALQQAAGPPPRDGFLDKLQASAEKLVRIRPLEEVAGSDPAAIISRIEVKAAHADLAGALAELAKLPPAMRAPAETWIGKAEARAAALDGSRRFAAAALAALGK